MPPPVPDALVWKCGLVSSTAQRLYETLLGIQAAGGEHPLTSAEQSRLLLQLQVMLTDLTNGFRHLASRICDKHDEKSTQ